MDELSLTQLKKGTHGITPEYGASLAQAASICLEEQKHYPGIKLNVDGDFKKVFLVCWDRTTEQMRRCWADLEFTTEQGAYGIATLLVTAITDLTVIERSRKGTGFDYWLGAKNDPEPLFQRKSRLEVSGIRKGDMAIIGRRVREKLGQIECYQSNLSAFVIVVEFSEPRSRVVER